MQISKILFSGAIFILICSLVINAYLALNVARKNSGVKASPSSVSSRDLLVQKILAPLNFKLVLSTSTQNGNTFGIVCNSFTATSSGVLPPCYATYYDKDFAKVRTIAIPMSNDVDEWDFRIIETGPSFIRFSLGEHMYGFGGNSQFVFNTTGHDFFDSLRRLVPCIGSCSQLNDNLFASALDDRSGINFILLSSSTDFYANPDYAKYKIGENDIKEGYGVIFESNGDPCRICGKPSVTLLENNKAEITLTRKIKRGPGSSVDGFDYDYKYKTVIVDLKHD